ncbi:MAG: response regulator [Bryobacterales bacterium]|nr:response regulator [Bryobacterales bacterium]
MRHVLKRIMSRSLWPKERILEAADGQEGLELARTPGVSLVLADIQMPVMGGLEMLQKIREDENLGDVLVLMVTAVTTRAAEVKARKLGAAGYIRKPFDPDQITSEVTRVWTAAGRTRLVAPRPLAQPVSRSVLRPMICATWVREGKTRR